MSFTQSPNMFLPIPGVGTEQGPNYAIDINNSLTLIDMHDHTSGKGVLITPSAININSTFSMNSNFISNIAGLILVAQASIPVNSTVYRSGVDLYYTDGLGNNIRLTSAGAVAGTPGSISGLTSPASASYVSGSSTFVWQSNTSIAANMDFGSALLRNLSPNSTYALTLSPPTLSSDYTITLPTLPLVKSVMQIDGSGNMSNTSAIDGVTLEDTGTLIQIKDDGVTSAKIAPAQIGARETINGTVTLDTPGSGTFTVPADINRLYVIGAGGGGGGGAYPGGGGLVTAGGGGNGAAIGIFVYPTTPGAVISYTIAAGGAAAGGSGIGSAGGTTTFDTYNFYGGIGGLPYTSAYGAVNEGLSNGGVQSRGKSGGEPAVPANRTGLAGENSLYALGGIGGGNGAGVNAGGGGGAASIGAGGRGADSSPGTASAAGVHGSGGGGGSTNVNGPSNGGGGCLIIYW